MLGRIVKPNDVSKTVSVFGKFGAMIQLSRATNTDAPKSHENHRITDALQTEENSHFSFKDQLKFSSEDLLRGTKGTEAECGKAEIVQHMLKVEEHHIVEIIRHVNGTLSDVIWCPVYVRPDFIGHARGGDQVSHHKCKICGLIAFHLLNDGQKYRPCLQCADWNTHEIPTWYYHDTCIHCEHYERR